jgi:hypothetical protein
METAILAEPVVGPHIQPSPELQTLGNLHVTSQSM